LKKKYIFTLLDTLKINTYIEDYITGDNKALGYIYDLYAVRLSMVAYRFLQNAQESNDVVMDVFEKLIQMNNDKRKVLVPKNPEGFTGWIITVTKNHTLDLIKHKKIVELYQADRIHQDVYSKPEVERVWDKQMFDEVINQLHNCEQKVTRLHFEGYSHEEIAQKLNVSYNTVRNQLSSAKKKIRKYISIPLIVLLLNLYNHAIL
jgi:RNA polymerase sigma-70 factor (ECF subfamily)